MQVDPCDAQAVAFFDPTTNGPGARLLPLVHVCCFLSNAIQSAHERRQQRLLDGEPDGEDDAEEAEIKAAILAEVGRPMADDDTLCAILVNPRNLQVLVMNGDVHAISRAFCLYNPKLVWPRLASLNLTWLRPTSELVPIAARLYLLPELRSLRLFIPRMFGEPTSDEQGVKDSGGASLVRPLDCLEKFSFSSCETDTARLVPFANLLSPAAPLESITWLGITPRALFEQLGRGKEPLRYLILGCATSPEGCARSSWPHLRLLGARVIEKLSFDLRSDTDEPESSNPQLALGEFLNNLPPTIRSAETARLTDFDSEYSYPLRKDETFWRIHSRVHAPLNSYLDHGTRMPPFRGRPCVQSVMVCMEIDRGGGDDDEEEEDDTPVPCIFARYGDADNLTDWHMLSPETTDERGRSVDASAQPLAGDE